MGSPKKSVHQSSTVTSKRAIFSFDRNLRPKIEDFGLANFFPGNKTHISTRVAGTLGYLAPEYAFRGQLTKRPMSTALVYCCWRLLVADVTLIPDYLLTSSSS